MARLPKENEAEIKAFLKVFNYFPWDYTVWRTADSSWAWYRGKASLIRMYDALVGGPSAGLKIGFDTRFFAFDIDVPGKKETFGSEVYRRTLLRAVAAEDAEPEGGPDFQDLVDGLGEKRLAEVEEAMERVPKVVLDPKEVAREALERRSLSVELKEAVKQLCGFFTEGPSLIVKSPHGVHVYYCLTEEVSWYKVVLPRLRKVKIAWETVMRERGNKLKIELKPAIGQPLRLPRKDRLIDVKSLEPKPETATVQELVDGIVCYPFERLFADDAIESMVAKASPKNKKEASGEFRKKLRTKLEAERELMPFRNGETNRQLISMVEAGKSEGMKIEEIFDWVTDWVNRSRGYGYTGDIDKDMRQLEMRVSILFDSCWVAKASWYIELWEEKKNGKIDEELAEKAIKRLQAKRAIASQGVARVKLFLGQLDLWKRIIDEEVDNRNGHLDYITKSNHARGVYPVPSQLLKKMYSGYHEVWQDIQAASLVTKDEDKAGSYIPDAGKPQYYKIDLV
jgi:hypothetical protein